MYLSKGAGLRGVQRVVTEHDAVAREQPSRAARHPPPAKFGDQRVFLRRVCVHPRKGGDQQGQQPSSLPGPLPSFLLGSLPSCLAGNHPLYLSPVYRASCGGGPAGGWAAPGQREPAFSSEIRHT